MVAVGSSQGSKEEYKSEVLAEVIFLTHNAKKHQYNLDNNLPGEDLLWTPEIQENKTSQYGVRI
jgi:spore photoproduct lyase